MFGSAVSRWTIHHFAVALIFFLLAQAAMVAGVAFPIVDLFGPTTLATVHLVTIGWLTILMLGALHQFVPVITAGGAAARGSALVSLVAIITGLVFMEAGFVALNGQLVPAAIALLPVGGTVVLAGVVVAVVALARTLWRSRPLAFSAQFIAAGLIFLLVTVVLGIIFGLAFAAPELVPWSGVFTNGLHLHLLAGLVGWFTLTAVGVSYRLLSMFTLAPEERGRFGTTIIVLCVGGLAVTWILELALSLGALVPASVVLGAVVATSLGLVLYLVDMVRLYQARRRRELELNTGMAIAALAAFAISLGLAIYASTAGFGEAITGAAAYLFLFGWLSGLGLSQLYKIVPFLTWLERYGSVLGKQPVPRVQDLVNERRDRPWFVAYFVAVAFGTLCIALGWPTLWRLAVFGHLVATAMIMRALWFARYRAPGQPQPISVRSTSPIAAPPPALGINFTTRSHAL
ncbi:MAG TPA: hypothetical protein VJR71_13465 [Pseudolabrys sp.]|nr:hypothetical protein [Pseudolabrys sp.]